MKRKDIGIVLAALCLSAALCAVPAGVFAVTDSALFSGAFKQNTRRGSLDVTGDDVYLARVLREPGEEIYIESNANPDLYSQTSEYITENTALDLSQSPLIQQTGFSDTVYLGIITNSARQDAAIEYIKYLFS